MEPMHALMALAWIFILALVLAVGALMREIRLLRHHLTANTQGYRVTASDIHLGQPVGPGGLVLAADNTCPLCLESAEAIARMWDGGTHETKPTLLQYHDAEWPSFVTDTFTVVTDSKAWQQIAHLSPPMLMNVGADGSVKEITAPQSGAEVQAKVREWGLDR